MPPYQSLKSKPDQVMNSPSTISESKGRTTGDDARGTLRWNGEDTYERINHLRMCNICNFWGRLSITLIVLERKIPNFNTNAI